MPAGTDVAVILPTDEQKNTSDRDIVIYMLQVILMENLMRIKARHAIYDPLMYVLIFLFCDKCWGLDYKSGKKKITPLQYYKCRLVICTENTFNTIHRIGRLLQQYIVDMHLKIEGECLKFM